MTTGDWVAFGPGDTVQDRFQVAAILPRVSAFTRLRVGAADAQVVAANIDVVLLAASLDRDLNPRSLERYLVMGWESGATPVVVLTKADCRSVAEIAGALELTRQVARGVDVLAVSATTGAGMEVLAERCLRPGRTAGVVGASGAGKSTLVNWMMGSSDMATGEVRADGKGRHTTSHRQLLVIPGKGILLDTPGLRSLGLWLSAEGLERTFPELADLAQDCRFSDCSHTQEPGCSVLAAVAGGVLSVERLKAWRKLGLEVLSVAARQGDLALRRAERDRWKRLARDQRPRSSY
ncbi:MAG: ribosome small subunit-dependent GTPase A [Candidatus Dormibacteria bacterium]